MAEHRIFAGVSRSDSSLLTRNGRPDLLAAQVVRVRLADLRVRVADEIVAGQFDHVHATFRLHTDMVGIGQPLEAGSHRAQQVRQRRTGEPQQSERFGTHAALHETEFAVVAEAFELEYQVAVTEFRRRMGLQCLYSSSALTPARDPSRPPAYSRYDHCATTPLRDHCLATTAVNVARGGGIIEL